MLMISIAPIVIDPIVHLWKNSHHQQIATGCTESVPSRYDPAGHLDMDLILSSGGS